MPMRISFINITAFNAISEQQVSDINLEISNEHTEYEWVDYGTAVRRVKYDSNRVALWELDNKIKLGLI